MSRMRIEASVTNHMGKVRNNNEDNFYLSGTYMELDKMDTGGAFSANRPGGVQLYAVCDGMGGEAAGEKASYQAVQTLSFFHEGLSTDPEDEQLLSLIGRISQSLNKQSQIEGSRSGTTIVLCVWNNGEMRCLHVGDSRIYRMHEGKLYQVTVDHSEVQRLVDMGVISPEEAKTHSKRHVISQYLGMPATAEMQIKPSLTAPIACAPGDMFLLCSDGLTDMVDDAVIEDILLHSENASMASNMLVQRALRNGGGDNVTAMCLRVVRRKHLEGFNWKQTFTRRKVFNWLGWGFAAIAVFAIVEMFMGLFS